MNKLQPVTLTADEWAVVNAFAVLGRAYAEGILAFGEVDPEVREHLDRMLDETHVAMQRVRKEFVDQILDAA